MKKILGFILISVLLIWTISFATVTTDPDITGIGGGGVSEGSNVGFENMSATRLNLDAGLIGAESDLPLSFGDGDTGFYELADDRLMFVGAGIKGWEFKYNYMQSSVADGAYIANTGSSSTIPVHTFKGDTDTGTGRAGANQLSLIAEGVEGVRIYKNGVDLKVAVAFSGISTITADYVMGNFTTDPTFFVECDTTFNNVSVTLSPVADKKGRLMEVKLMSAANDCYIDGNGAETIDGASGQVITTLNDSLSLIAGSTQWLIH